MRKECAIDKRIALYGTPANIGIAEEIIETNCLRVGGLSEGAARLELQNLIDTTPIKVDILFEGNGVYSKKKIIRDIKRVKKNGMQSMTNGLYKFLSLCCGSIAHYNKQGWIEEYPTLNHLKSFFQRNEFGERVLNHIPQWRTDAKEIIKEIELVLEI